MTFEGIVGSSYTGDLAIDDVSISSGSCQGKTAFTLPTVAIGEMRPLRDPHRGSARKSYLFQAEVEKKEFHELKNIKGWPKYRVQTDPVTGSS